MYSVALYIVASNLLTKNLYTYTKNQSWLPVLIATAISIVMMSVYGKLVKNYPGCGLFEINANVFGIIGGKIISALYAFFFLSLTVFNTRDMGDFVNSIVLPATPPNVVFIVFLMVCVYAVKKGAQKLTQYSTLIIYVYIVLLLFISALLLPKMHVENFLPVLTLPPRNFLLSTFLAQIPLNEAFAFIMVIPFVQKPEASGKAFRRGLIIGASVILFLVIRDIAVLGNYTLYTSSPTINTIRLIDVGDVLTRLEIINAVLQMCLLFFKTSILLYAVVASFSKLFNIEEYRKFVLVVGALVIVCSNFFFVSSAERVLWFSAAATYGVFFFSLLPAGTLIISEIKKRTSRGEPPEPRTQPKKSNM